MDIAASAQKVLEICLIKICQYTKKITKKENLCLAGGVALNCVANSKILNENIFKNIWIQPASGDSGASLGCALHAYFDIFKDKTKIITKSLDNQNGTYLGSSYTNEYIKKFDVKTPSSERLITLLSGGNQQKILLSRWLLRNLKIIILDEPTRGVDIGAKTEILNLINDLAKDGLSVILMTSEMNDLLTLSDRIVVMASGKISKEFNRNEATQEDIFKAAVG